MWNPYGVDEILCQLDAARVAWVVLTDRNNTPAALVSGNTGLVHEQYSVDPFGEVLAAEQLRSGCALLPSLKIGYQGLFAERFSETLTKFPLTAGARSIVHNRARTYVPYLGRFLQSDPHASGIALSNPDAPLGGYGSTPAALKINISPDMQYADGGNLYAAVGGNPVERSDPRGLFGFVAGLSAGLNMADMASDMMDQAYDGVSTGLALDAMIDSYAVMQEVNVDWVLDWSRSDEGSTYSQSFTLGTGVWADNSGSDEDAEECDEMSEESDDGPALASGVRLGPKQNRADYEKKRSQWSNVRRAMWKREAQSKDVSEKWSKADIQRMKQGLAPKGWSIHHRKPLASGGTNKAGNLYFIPTKTHREKTKEIHSPPYPVPRDARPAPRKPRIR